MVSTACMIESVMKLYHTCNFANMLAMTSNYIMKAFNNKMMLPIASYIVLVHVSCSMLKNLL